MNLKKIKSWAQYQHQVVLAKIQTPSTHSYSHHYNHHYCHCYNQCDAPLSSLYPHTSTPRILPTFSSSTSSSHCTNSRLFMNKRFRMTIGIVAKAAEVDEDKSILYRLEFVIDNL